jgi:hypothetical protein
LLLVEKCKADSKMERQLENILMELMYKKAHTVIKIKAVRQIMLRNIKYQHIFLNCECQFWGCI